MKSQLTFSFNKSGDQEGQAAEMDNANIGLINPAWLTQGVTFTMVIHDDWMISLGVPYLGYLATGCGCQAGQCDQPDRGGE